MCVWWPGTFNFKKYWLKVTMDESLRKRGRQLSAPKEANCGTPSVDRVGADRTMLLSWVAADNPQTWGNI